MMKQGLLILATLLSLGLALDFSVIEGGGRPPRYTGPEKKYAAPSIALPLFSGTVAIQPETVQIFWDYERYVFGSLFASLYFEGLFVKNCTYSTQDIHFEYVSIPWNPSNCYLSRPGLYELFVSAQNRNNLVSEIFEFEIILLESSPKPWPLENEEGVWPPNKPNLAANLVHNYQSFSGQASAYWHEGIDIRSELLPGQDLAGILRSPVDGTVVNWVRYSSSDLYWSLMVQESRGLVWQFHHLDPSTVSVKVGQAVKQGDVLGNIAYWPSSHNGELYHHVHMNVAKPHPSWTSIPNPYVNGWQYFNGIKLLDNGGFTGGIKPVSDGIFYFLKNGQTAAFAASSDSSTPVLSGDIDVVINLYSEFESTNSVPGHPYNNGIYEVGYYVEPLVKTREKSLIRNEITPGFVAPLPLLRADKTPNQWSYNLPDFTTADSDTMLRRVYKQSFTYNGRSYTSTFTYTQRRMYYTVTNSFRGEPDETNGFWDTDALIPGSSQRRFPNGNYLLGIYAIDEYGNRLDLTTQVIVSN